MIIMQLQYANNKERSCQPVRQLERGQNGPSMFVCVRYRQKVEGMNALQINNTLASSLGAVA